MELLEGKVGWLVVGSASAALAGYLARRALKTAWRAVRGEDPPENAGPDEVGWRDAIAWTALSGLVVGVARMAAERVAHRGWTGLTGSPPPKAKLL